MEKEVLQSVAQYLSQGFRPPTSVLITITHVRMPGDLRTAKIYVSLLFNNSKSGDINGTPAEVQDVLKALQSCAADFQDYLASQLKSRYCPKITFFQDDTTENVLRVEKILQDLKAEKTSSSVVPQTSENNSQEED